MSSSIMLLGITKICIYALNGNEKNTIFTEKIFLKFIKLFVCLGLYK